MNLQKSVLKQVFIKVYLLLKVLFLVIQLKLTFYFK